MHQLPKLRLEPNGYGSAKDYGLIPVRLHVVAAQLDVVVRALTETIVLVEVLS